MGNFKNFKVGQTFRLELKHFVNSRYHTEIIYAKFKKVKYLGETEIVEELHLSQIIDVEEFLNDRESREIERIIHHLKNYNRVIGYKLNDR